MTDLRRDILNALYWDIAVPKHKLTFRIEKGWVTLSGQVEMAYEKRCAETDVLKVPGVMGVINQIVVHSSIREFALRPKPSERLPLHGRAARGLLAASAGSRPRAPSKRGETHQRPNSEPLVSL
jgi:hypothetical protein